MNPTLGVVIMMNNYFHDVATALLLASGITMWVVMQRFGSSTDRAVMDYVLRLYHSITKLAIFSIVWIILGGIPRTVFYVDFEWANAAGKNQVPALIVKHILFFIIVGAGASVWIKMSKRVKIIRNSLKQATPME